MRQTLTPEIINAAITGFEQQKSRIDDQIAELRSLLPGGHTHTATSEVGPPRRKRFTAAARRKMALAQKARWAKIRGEAEPPAPAPAEAPKPKRRISEEGLKRISAATKKRWALKRAEAVKAKKAASAQKKAPVKKGAVKAPATKVAVKKRAPVKKAVVAKTVPTVPATPQGAG